jgi:RNA polymerase sigma-70 factor (ECF subfamily)
MDPTLGPLEPAEATPVRRVALAESLVAAAWTDHHEALYAFLVRATREPAVAEDLLSEAYARLLAETRAGRAPDNLRAWLYRVAANLVASRGRRLGAARRWLDRVGRPRELPADPPADVPLLAREAQRELVAALAALAPDARAALLLSAEGFAGTEIAAAIGRTPAATRTLLCRARIRVRATLADPEASR